MYLTLFVPQEQWEGSHMASQVPYEALSAPLGSTQQAAFVDLCSSPEASSAPGEVIYRN